MAKPWLVLTHTHSYWKVRVHHEDVLDALPAGASLALDLVEFHDEQPDVPVAEIAWREEQIRQARLWDSKKDMVVNQCKASPMAYFGATFIPLAMDLGQRLMTWRSPAVYQQHHHEKHWRWTGRPEGMTGPGVTIDGVPPEIDSRPGDVVLRIAASYPIDPSKTRSVLPNPLAELDLKLCPIALDPFATPAELEQMVVAFHGALRVIQERLPNARRLHLFLAGPVGLALRLGGAINPTIYPPVQVWQYDYKSNPCYHRALILGRTSEQLTMKLKILFLASEPQTPTDRSKRLHLDQEHRQIVSRLREGEQRDRFDLVPHIALRARDLQAHIDREKPTIVHFSGHGDETGQLIVEDERGRIRELPVAAVVETFRAVNDRRQIRLLVLNACHSHVLARQIADSGAVDCVIGMTEAVPDDVAIIFAEELYRALSDGNSSAQRAFDLAKNQARLVGTHHSQDCELPELFCAPGVDASRIHLLE